MTFWRADYPLQVTGLKTLNQGASDVQMYRWMGDLFHSIREELLEQELLRKRSKRKSNRHLEHIEHKGGISFLFLYLVWKLDLAQAEMPE